MRIDEQGQEGFPPVAAELTGVADNDLIGLGQAALGQQIEGLPLSDNFVMPGHAAAKLAVAGASETGPVAAAKTERSREQRMSALERANQVRSAAKALKGEMKGGALTFAEAASDPRAGHIKVQALIQAVPGVGRVKARSVLADVRISPNRRIENLTERQRTQLIDTVPQPSAKVIEMAKRHQKRTINLAQIEKASEASKSVRMQRAEVKHALKRGQATVADALSHDAFVTAEVQELICALHTMGRWRTNQLLAHISVSPSRPVGSLTIRQRAALLEQLASRGFL